MKKRTRFAAIAFALLAPLSHALEIGDPAPDLNLSKVLKGDEVKASLKDSGQVTVVEFWATWCGPCRQSIPHLTELQAKYKDKKVRIVGISDESEAQVAPFVTQQGDEMAYTVALDEGKKTWDAYATPFGVTGIPHAFVVDAAGTLMWHGHPLDGLDEVLAKVVEGKYDIATAREEALKDAMQAELSELTMIWAQEYLVLAKYGRDKDGADAVGKKILDSGFENEVFFGQFAWTLLSQPELAHNDLQYMLTVAERANKLANGESADILDTLALAFFKNGQVEKAVATQEKAIELCDNEELMKQLKERLAQYKTN